MTGVDNIRVRIDRVSCMLRCSRCWKYEPDVGKIKEWPDVCMRCAVAIEYMVDTSRAPDGSFRDWSAWVDEHERRHKDNPLRRMETTMTVDRGARAWGMVYMPRDIFIQMYGDGT